MVEEAKSLVKELLGIQDGYQVLFLGGGASMQFAMAPYNFLRDNGTAGYINTGAWAKKAIKEGKKLGNTVIIASSEVLTSWNQMSRPWRCRARRPRT